MRNDPSLDQPGQAQAKCVVSAAAIETALQYIPSEDQQSVNVREELQAALGMQTDQQAYEAMTRRCEACKGTGQQAGWTDQGGMMRCVPESCDTCKGTGHATADQQEGGQEKAR